MPRVATLGCLRGHTVQGEQFGTTESTANLAFKTHRKIEDKMVLIIF